MNATLEINEVEVATAVAVQAANERNAVDIEQWADILFPAGAVVEMRIPKAKAANGRNLGTISGYYDDHTELAQDIKSCSGKYTAVYYTLNPVSPSLPSRSCNKSRENATETTQDSQIVRRRWLLLDIDPQRAAGISASDEEKSLAYSKMAEVGGYLKEQGWPLPLIADSGNGYHLLYRIDLENTSDVTALLKAVLGALADKFDSKQVKVDKSVFNAARIVKAYGSMARKGEELPSQHRYHRMSKLLNTSGGKVCVSLEQLTAAAVSSVSPKVTAAPAMKSGLIVNRDTNITPDQLRTWLEKYDSEITSEADMADGRHKFVLSECLFNSEHANKDAAVFWSSTGPQHKCLHNSCMDNGWKQFRVELETRTGKRYSIKTGEELTGDRVEETGPKKRLKLTPLTDVKECDLEWLWPDRIPLGLATVFTGDAGIGKTLMALDLAARLSTGSRFIDGSANPPAPCSILALSAEDDAATMLKPRFMVAEGDTKRFFLCEGVEDVETGDMATVRLDQDLAYIRQALQDDPAIRLVIIDPLMSYLGSKDSYKDQELRKVLDPLSALAKEFNIAILVIAHTSKKTSMPNQLHRIGGSAAIGEVARMGWIFQESEDKSFISVAQIKFNLGRFSGINFRTILEANVRRPDLKPQARIHYIGENKQSAEDLALLNEDSKGKLERKVDKRRDYLRGLFKDTEKVYTHDFKESICEKFNCDWKTIKRDAKELGISQDGQAVQHQVPRGPNWRLRF